MTAEQVHYVAASELEVSEKMSTRPKVGRLPKRASSHAANCFRSRRYPSGITTGICADISKPDGKKVGHDISGIAFTDPISKQDFTKLGWRSRSRDMFSIAILSSTTRRMLGKHLNQSTIPAKTEAGVTYFGRPIALAFAVVSSALMAPTAMPRNHSAEASQSVPPSGTATKPAILSVGTTVVAKLLANLDSGTCRPGDPVEAEVTRDVSQNHKVVLKAGARVIGHVVALDASSAHKPGTRIAISLKSVSMKSGEQAQISFVIQALAIAPRLKEKNEIQGGHDTESNVFTAAAAGGSIGGPLSEGQLRPEDSGVYGIAGLSLTVMTTETGSQFPVLKSSSENIRLAKGTQMVLRVVQN
jgi:hypothetical protein